MRDFYLTISTDSSLNTFQTYKQSDVIVKLDDLIYIEKDAWDVALMEIITPSQVINISEENNYFFLAFLDQRILDSGKVIVTEMCGIENTYGKLSTLGFLRRNLYSCPQEVKEAAYKGLVRPVLDYGSSVWDPPGVVLQEE